MSIPVIVRVHYYSPDSKKRAFYSSSSSNDYMTYIDKGIDVGRGADRDYMEYMGNPDKSTGVFNSDGILSGPQRKDLRNQLREAKGNIWDLVISLDGDLGKDRLCSYEQAYSLVIDVLPKLFRRMNFSKNNIVWYAGLHTNTDHRHVHISFFEKEPTFYNQARKEYRYRKGRISPEYINLLKADVEEHLFSDKEETKLRRRKALEEIKDMSVAFDDPKFPLFLQKEIKALMEEIPMKGRHSYASLPEPIQKHADSLSFSLLINSANGQDLLNHLSMMRAKEKQYAKKYKVKPTEYKSDRILKDVYRRIGNDVIGKIIAIRNESMKELEGIRNDRLKRKKELSRIRFLTSKIKALSDEEERANEEYMEQLKAQVEKEILMEKGIIDADGKSIELEKE